MEQLVLSGREFESFQAMLEEAGCLCPLLKACVFSIFMALG